MKDLKKKTLTSNSGEIFHRDLCFGFSVRPTQKISLVLQLNSKKQLNLRFEELNLTLTFAFSDNLTVFTKRTMFRTAQLPVVKGFN